MPLMPRFARTTEPPSTGNRPNRFWRRDNSVVPREIPSYRRIITSNVWRRIRISIAGTSCASSARAERDEKLVQLTEQLVHPLGCSGTGCLESFFRGIELVHHQ